MLPDRVIATLPGIGIFGTSEIVKVLVPILKEKGFQIKALWGKSLMEAEKTAKSLNIPFYSSKIDDILLRKDVDLVYVLCEPYLQSQISVKSLGIGKHIVASIPCGLGQADTWKMLKAARYYPTLISLVNHSLRFLPNITQMKKALHEEIIGPLSDVTLIDISVKMGSLLHNNFNWLCDSNAGGGCLTLVGSHIIDICHYLTGKKAIRVHGLVKTFKTSTEHVNGIRQITAPDFCNFQMELEGGILCIVNIQSNQFNQNSFEQDVTITGKDGILKVVGGDLICLRKKGNDQEFKEDKLYLDLQDMRITSPESSLPRPYVKGLCKMVTALKEAFTVPENSSTAWIKEPVASAANFEDALYVQSVLEAIKKSSDDRCWIRVSIMSESPTNHDKFLAAARLAMH